MVIQDQFADSSANEHTGKGQEMFKKLMQQGYEEVYFREARALLNSMPANVEHVVKQVLGEQQYILHMQHGWDLQQAESRGYGQIFVRRWMRIDRAKLEAEVEAHEELLRSGDK